MQQNQNGIHLGISKIFENIKLSDVITLDKSVSFNKSPVQMAVQMASDDFSLIREHIEKDIASTISRKCITIKTLQTNYLRRIFFYYYFKSNSYLSNIK